LTLIFIDFLIELWVFIDKNEIVIIIDIQEYCFNSFCRTFHVKCHKQMESDSVSVGSIPDDATVGIFNL
jgi:hypothetical protein